MTRRIKSATCEHQKVAYVKNDRTVEVCTEDHGIALRLEVQCRGYINRKFLDRQDRILRSVGFEVRN